MHKMGNVKEYLNHFKRKPISSFAGQHKIGYEKGFNGFDYLERSRGKSYLGIFSLIDFGKDCPIKKEF